MIVSRVGRRGQLTLPKEIREQVNLKEGDHVGFVVDGDHVILQPLIGTIADHRGSIPVTGPQDFDAIRRQVIASRARSGARREQ